MGVRIPWAEEATRMYQRSLAEDRGIDLNDPVQVQQIADAGGDANLGILPAGTTSWTQAYPSGTSPTSTGTTATGAPAPGAWQPKSIGMPAMPAMPVQPTLARMPAQPELPDLPYLPPLDLPGWYEE